MKTTQQENVMRSAASIFLAATAAIALAACTIVVDDEGEALTYPVDEHAKALAEDGAGEPFSTLSGDDPAVEAYCWSPCDPPTYDGNPVSCSGTACTAHPGYVVCDGNVFMCTAVPPSSCNKPNFPSCSSERQCDTICGGPGYGDCIQACCYCL
jgi:hypothetical protein